MSRAARVSVFFAGAILVFILYRPGLSSPFVYDDLVTIVHNAHVLDESPVKAMSFNPFRSLVYLTFDIQFHLAHDPERKETSTLPFHLLNLALHFLNGIMLFLVLERIGRGAKHLAPAAAAIFLLHPLCTEAVNFISARFTLMASLFYLAAIYFHLDPENRKTSQILFWLCFIPGLFCKETMATLPLSLALINHVQKRPQRMIIPAFVAVGIYILLRLNWTIILSKSEEEQIGPLSYFLAQNLSLWLYALKSIVPLHLNFDYHLNPSRPALITLTIFNMCILAVLIRSALKRSKWTVIPLLFLIILLPTSSFIPLDDTFRETRAYLPTALTSILIAWLAPARLKEGQRKGMVRIMILIFVLAALCGLTRDRNDAWVKPASLWRDTVTKSPLKHRPVYNYGNALRRELRLEEALVQYERAHGLDPAHINTIRNIDMVKRALASPELDRWKEELRSRSR